MTLTLKRGIVRCGETVDMYLVWSCRGIHYVNVADRKALFGQGYRGEERSTEIEAMQDLVAYMLRKVRAEPNYGDSR